MGSLQQREENLTAEFIQAESPISLDHFSGRKTPLFLIHDGGGTTFTYHCLDVLGRFVFAIANPRFASAGGFFEGGLREMGSLYAGYIKKTILGDEFPAAARRRGGGRSGQKVEILLGGWSLGGLLSLEVARLLVDDEKVAVKGIVMIDSPYQPKDMEVRREEVEAESAGFEVDEEGKSKNQILAQRSMTSARRMVADWEIPTWEGAHQHVRPKTILLKAQEYVPTQQNGGKAVVDRYREDPQLGWSEHGEDFLEEVVDIPGDHFSLAVEPYLEDTSRALRKACDALDSVPRALYMY